MYKLCTTEDVGVDMQGVFPKPLTDRVMEAMDVSVTMGCGDVCPVFSTLECRDWGLPDPHGAGKEMVTQLRDEIKIHVKKLLQEKGIPTIED